MNSKTCEWNSTGYTYDTECGYTHFAYYRPRFQPDIKYDEEGNKIRPYCGKSISFEEDKCDAF